MEQKLQKADSNQKWEKYVAILLDRDERIQEDYCHFRPPELFNKFLCMRNSQK